MLERSKIDDSVKTSVVLMEHAKTTKTTERFEVSSEQKEAPCAKNIYLERWDVPAGCTKVRVTVEYL